ncbi:MAG: NAD(P)-binding domain-containing protein [Propionibacteriaceae bacterium]|nr:NAD(P)-binding domain-containing protein [Propionibacteriaceae bacterium]
MRIGVIGVGIIGEAFIRGVLAAQPTARVFLSPRNAERAAALAAEFANVEVLASNQAVLDASEWVVLSVLAPSAPEILGALRFREDHRVITLIGGYHLDEVRALIGPTATLARMVPLPYIVHQVGPLATYPLTAEVEAEFAGLGELFPAPDEPCLDVIVAITAMMSALFATLGGLVSWADAHGLSPELAQRFTLEFVGALLYKAGTLRPDELVEHWREMTPGGLNHESMTALQQAGAFAAWSAAMDRVWARINSAGK